MTTCATIKSQCVDPDRQFHFTTSTARDKKTIVQTPLAVSAFIMVLSSSCAGPSDSEMFPSRSRACVTPLTSTDDERGQVRCTSCERFTRQSTVQVSNLSLRQFLDSVTGPAPSSRNSFPERRISTSGLLRRLDTPTPPSSPDSAIWEDMSDSYSSAGSGGEVGRFRSQLLAEDSCPRMRTTDRRRTRSLPRGRRLCCTGVEVSTTRKLSDGAIIDGAQTIRRSNYSWLVHFHCWLARQPHTWL